MSKDDKRRPILYNGQIYGEPVIKRLGGSEKSMRFSYEESRESLLSDISQTRRILKDLPLKSRLPHEFVLSLKLLPEYSAKSYYPDSLFDITSEIFGLTEIGSRIWREKSHKKTIQATNGENMKSSKMLFVRATEESLINLERHLRKNTLSLKKNFITDVRKISSFGILPTRDQILGLPEDWESGELEAVLHPFDIDQETVLSHFLNHLREAGIKEDTIKYKQYSSGVSFVNFIGNQKVLNHLENYNPLRTIHPIAFRSLPNVPRSNGVKLGPKAPTFTIKSHIVVGVLDGGLDINNPYTKDYTDSEFSVSGKPVKHYVDHGTMVTGTVLYGPLNKYTFKDTLPEPKVAVRNFGVLSSDTKDPNLYDAIDAIEKIVPANEDIKVYNLSLGPSGPIYDDSISRFTYSVDLLSYQHEVLFCVAVGNDGEIAGYDRIQAPSDSINCLAVGAYTKIDGCKIRAPYSSIGPGREGNKMKPDVMAFGGCAQSPIHLISSIEGERVSSDGTSFASPIVANLAGRLIGESNGTIDSLIAKALLVHAAENENSSPGHCFEMGHGVVPEEVEKIVTCEDKSYTLIYRGELDSGKYAEFLVPWEETITQGKAEFKWTVAVLSEVDQLSPDDYTTSSVEVAFYPNKNKYKFINKDGVKIDGELKKSETVDVLEDPERAAYLLANGWTQNNFPITGTAVKQFKNEGELREDLKWDSIDTREAKKIAKTISTPAFHIHALGRGSRKAVGKVKFALILSVTTPKAEVDLYENILNKYSALIPLEVNTNVNARIQIGD